MHGFPAPSVNRSQILSMSISLTLCHWLQRMSHISKQRNVWLTFGDLSLELRDTNTFFGSGALCEVAEAMDYRDDEARIDDNIR